MADLQPPLAESARVYLERTLLLPSLECGVEEMLRACTKATEEGEHLEPLTLLAQWLMRNNPRHNAQARDRLAAHTVAKQSSETMFPSTQTAAGVEPVTPAEENEAEEKEAVAESKAEAEAEVEAEAEDGREGQLVMAKDEAAGAEEAEAPASAEPGVEVAVEGAQEATATVTEAADGEEPTVDGDEAQPVAKGPPPGAEMESGEPEAQTAAELEEAGVEDEVGAAAEPVEPEAQPESAAEEE